MSESDATIRSQEKIEQWVSRVVGYSSQYNTNSWSSNQVIGPPKVYPRYGDIIGSWAQGSRSNNEYIIVEFKEAVYPEQIDIYETFNPGAVVKVLVRNGKHDSAWETVWETEAPHVESQSRIFSIPCANICNKEINQIYLNVNCSAAGTWCEIDCIKLTGYTSNVHKLDPDILADLKTLLTDDILSDVTFQLDNGKLIPSYRNVLSVRCIYFKELFNEYPLHKSETIRIRNISYEAFYQILHFIFTDTIQSTITYAVCLELMRKADEYFLSAIYIKAFDVLKKIMDKKNVLNIFMQSGLFPTSSDDNQDDLIVLNDVTNLCIEFIKNNRRDICIRDNLQQLSKDVLLKLIELIL